MNEPIISHNLIEYMLSVLSVLERNNIDHNILTTKDGYRKISPLLDSMEPQKIRTAFEVINFMDEMPGGFFIYHADDKEQIIYANKAVLRIFQCDTMKEFRELTGNSFKGLVYHRDLAKIERSIKAQIAASQYDLDYVEYRIVRKDGIIRWIEDYGHFIQSKSIGDIFYVFIGDATEKVKRHLLEKSTLINEKKENELKIKNLKEEYDKEKELIYQEHLQRLKVIEGLSINYESILYANLDEDQIVPYRLSSRTEHQFEKRFQPRKFSWYVSDYVDIWVHPEDKELVSKVTSLDYIRKELSKQSTYYVNYRVLNRGETQYLQLRIVNVSTSDHVFQIVMGYRRVDKEIQQEMEQKQILKDALYNANLAITAKNTFLANMSHDIRTPLNAIFGFTELAKKHKNDSVALQKYLKKIETSSEHLLDLINKVLQLTWAETNDIQITESKCNLCDIMQEVYDSVSTWAVEKNITLSLDSTKMQHHDIYSDHDKIKQLLLYLVNNALKYTHNDGQVTMSVAEQDNLPNDHAIYRFVVTDNGIGIGADFLEHIFEPFEREKNTTFSGVYGTGLGLTIAKNIVDMMSGTIEVDSTVGKGTTFTVTLNLRKHNQSQNTASSADTDAILDDIKRKKILLVEDNEINLEIETEILQGLGFLTETAINGSIAVEKMKNSAPGEYALVLMDIQMPIMNGLQAAKAIRNLENPKLARIPIIALSANAFESDKKLSIESGMDEHLTKPIDIPLLLETFVKTIQNHKKLYGD